MTTQTTQARKQTQSSTSTSRPALPKLSTGQPVLLNLTDITLDDEIQCRESISEATVAEYAEKMLDGAVFPAAVVYFDGSKYWLADGTHRYKGAEKAGKSQLLVEVRAGGRKDA